MADIQRITEMMSNVVREAASEHLSEDDEFDFDVGLIPVVEQDEDGPVFEVGAWAVFRLGCPESEQRSVMGLNAPLRYLTKESFRDIVNQTLGEMRFSRIVAAFDSDGEAD